MSSGLKKAKLESATADDHFPDDDSLFFEPDVFGGVAIKQEVVSQPLRPQDKRPFEKTEPKMEPPSQVS
jgi:hypothetical protein